MRILSTTRALEPNARLSDVYGKSGLSEDEFAKSLGEAESQGLIRRETTNEGIRLVLTVSGRQVFEQSFPQ